MRIFKIARSALLTLFVSHCLGMDHLSREAQGSITYNRALAGYVISSFETPGFLSCAHKCLCYPSCKSCNYHPTAKGLGLCEINNNEGDLEANFIGLEGSLFAKLTRQEVSKRLENNFIINKNCFNIVFVTLLFIQKLLVEYRTNINLIKSGQQV